MTMALNVMVLESEHGAADEAKRELAAAGHVVLECHDPDAPAFPCRGLVDTASCPLHAPVIDVALTVRSRVRSQPAPTEDGVRCALMQHVPLVVAGPAALEPFDGFETTVLDRTYDLVSAVESAAAAELGAYARRAETVIAQSIGVTGDIHPSVSVTRRAGGLRVVVRGLDDVARAHRQAAIVRVVGALRQFDRAARMIDVEMGDVEMGDVELGDAPA